MDSFTQEASERAKRLMPLVLTVREACFVLRISKSMLYQYIHTGQLETVKMGSRRLVHLASIQALLNRLSGKEGDGGAQS